MMGVGAAGQREGAGPWRSGWRGAWTALCLLVQKEDHALRRSSASRAGLREGLAGRGVGAGGWKERGGAGRRAWASLPRPLR